MSAKKLDEVVLAIIDLSGSMVGQSIATAQAQVQELLWELKATQTSTANVIRFGLMGFADAAGWILRPKNVDEINDLPVLQIKPDESGLYPGTSYSAMLTELERSLNPAFLCDQYPINSLHVILFSDCFSTDGEQALRGAMERLKGNAVFADRRCRCYVIRDELDRDKGRLDYRTWLVQAFTRAREHVTDAAGFSDLISRISAELTGGGDGNPESVF